MTVSLTDKRRGDLRISGLDLANGTWFAVLDLPGMESLVSQKHTNDPLNVTAAKARKMAAILSDWRPPATWASSDVKLQNLIKASLIAFLLNCNGFRSM